MSDKISDSAKEQLRYRLLAENMCDLVCLHAPDGKYEYVSPSVATLLGFCPHELIGTSPYDLIHAEEINCVREDMFERLPKSGDGDLTVDYRMRKKSGEYVWVETVPRLVVVADGKPAQILTVSRDITKRKTAQRELAAAQEEIAKIYFSEQAARAEAEAAHREAEAANRAKDEFLQLISHEFRTPLTTVKTLARIMQQGGETEVERGEYLETIVSECDRQIDMIMNLLDVARLDEKAVVLHGEPVNLNLVLRSCGKIQRHAADSRGQTFDVKLDESLPLAFGDEKMMRRALCSIIENAVKYTPIGGKIEVFAERTTRISAANEKKDAAHQSAAENENNETTDEIAIIVQDNGRGINPEDVSQLFRKFYRGKKTTPPDANTENADGDIAAPGVGLGLYLANRLITELGGRIEVASEIGRGSRFTIFLAAWNENARQPDLPDEQESDEHENREINGERR